MEPIQAERRARLPEYILPPEYKPWSVVALRPDNVWFTLDGTGEVAYLTPRNGDATVTRVPLAPESKPFLMSLGPDQTLWLSDFEYVADPPPARIWHIKDGKPEAIELADRNLGPAMVAVDPAGVPRGLPRCSAAGSRG